MLWMQIILPPFQPCGTVRGQAWINAAGALLGRWSWYCAFGTLRGSVVNWAGLKRTEAGLAGTKCQFADSISWRAIDLADVSSPYPYSYL